MKKAILASVLLSLSFAATPAEAVESIKVLIARGGGVPAQFALSRLQQLNDLMHNSGLAEYDFVNAGDHLGVTDLTVTSPCITSNENALIACAMLDVPGVDDLTEHRNTYDADIVLLVVPLVNAAVCGVTPPLMFNLDTISPNNRQFGYAAVGFACNLTSSFISPVYTSSHEVLHLLSIEHKINDDEINKPVADNHAYTGHRYMSAGAKPADCGSTNCNFMENKMSNPLDSFGNNTSMGTTAKNNAKRVVSEQSWAAVAAYLPLPPPQTSCNIQFDLCSEGFPQTLATAFWPGQSMSHVDLDYQPLGLSSWYPIYEGNPSCAAYNTPIGPSIVRAIVTNVLGQVTSCSVTIGADLCGDGGFF